MLLFVRLPDVLKGSPVADTGHVGSYCRHCAWLFTLVSVNSNMEEAKAQCGL